MAYAPAERAVRGPTPANSARRPPRCARMRSDPARPGLDADVCACVCARTPHISTYTCACMSPQPQVWQISHTCGCTHPGPLSALSQHSIGATSTARRQGKADPHDTTACTSSRPGRELGHLCCRTSSTSLACKRSPRNTCIGTHKAAPRACHQNAPLMHPNP